MWHPLTELISIVFIICSLLSISEQQYTPDWESLDARPLPKCVPAISSEWYVSLIGHSLIDVSHIGTVHTMWCNWQGTDPSQTVVDYMKANYPPDWTYANVGLQLRADLYDPNEWADLFAASGAEYVVRPSKVSLSCRDLASAIRNRTDVVFGFYYSLFERFNPLYLRDKSNHFTPQDYTKAKVLPELKEIVETYKREIVWTDEPLDHYWNATQFLAWLYNDSPVKDTVVVNDRWGSGRLCKHGGFYTCLDRFNPGHLVEHKWENCFTIDKRSWAYRPIASIDDCLTIEELLKEVVTTISTGGNALINVGPNMHGKIPPIFQERLQQMGSWLKVNGEGLYASVLWNYQNDTVNSDVWYTSSKDGKYVFAFLLMWPKNTTEIMLGAPLTSSNTVVTLMGSVNDSLQWRVAVGNRGLAIDVSNVRPHLLESQWICTFKLTNLITDNITSTTVERTTLEPTTPQCSGSASFLPSLLFFVILYLLHVEL